MVESKKYHEDELELELEEATGVPGSKLKAEGSIARHAEPRASVPDTVAPATGAPAPSVTVPVIDVDTGKASCCPDRSPEVRSMPSVTSCMVVPPPPDE